MQVRLANEPLRGPVADTEVESYVTEGNHWQWHFTPREISEGMAPGWMFEGIPRAALLLSYYDTLREIGIVAGN